MLIVGLTGGIGSGKSTAAEMLDALGAVVVDADRVARQVVEPGTPGFDAIVERFGLEVVGPDGSLDRARVAEIVFHDDEARSALNDITHPLVGAEMIRQVGEAAPDAVVVLDVPLLAENPRQLYDCIVVVEAPRDVRLDRLERRGLDRADAEARMAAQATDEDRRAVADHVLDNAGDRGSLRAQVEVVWADLLRRRDAKAAGDADTDAP